MAREHIIVARTAGGTAPVIQHRRFTDGETFKIGAVMIEGTATQGYIKEGASDARLDIHGITTEAVDLNPGNEFGFATTVKQVTGLVQRLPIYVADDTTVYSGKATTAVALTNIDLEYAFVKSADGTWRIDFGDTGNVAVKVIDVDVDEDIVFWRFLVAALAVGV